MNRKASTDLNKGGILQNTFFRQVGLPILTALIIGFGSIVYSAHIQTKITTVALDAQNNLTQQRFDFISHEISRLSREVKELQGKVELAGRDRWTQGEHDQYAEQLREQIRSIEQRLRVTEQEVSRLKSQ